MSRPGPGGAAGRRIVIFGLYKSGTTGLFSKVRNSLTGPVRCLFEQRRYSPEVGDADAWVLAKTILHLEGPGCPIDYPSFTAFDRIVLLVRDPRDWVVSGTLFLIQQEASIYRDQRKLERVMELLRRKETRPGSLPLHVLLRSLVGMTESHRFEEVLAWMRELFSWLPEFEARLPPHVRVRYEDFVRGELRGLEAYLGIRLSGSAAVSPEHDHVPRTCASGHWPNWFCPSDVDVFRPIFEDFIRHYGYDQDWILSSRPAISPEHCSGYVRRVVEKRLRARE